MGKAKWSSGKFILTDSHDMAAAAWGKALDAVLAELFKLEDETQAGISISFIGLYKRLGQLDFCTLEEFRQMVDQLLNERGEIGDASDGESGEEPLCLTAKGRAIAQSRWETTRTLAANQVREVLSIF
jgi:hypothetical protein